MRCINTIPGHANWVFSVAISPHGQIIASGSRDPKQEDVIGMSEFWQRYDAPPRGSDRSPSRGSADSYNPPSAP